MTVTEMVSEFADNLAVQYGDAVPTTLGMLKLAENDTTPRVVFVPTDIIYGPAHGPGRNPRPLATHKQQFTIHCWHDDFDAAFALVLKVEAALFLTFGTSLTFRKGTWGAPSWSAKGIVGKPVIELDVPITELANATAVITNVHGTTGLESSVEPGPSY
jgi:hypothetical protein